jgi:hypothetical protein
MYVNRMVCSPSSNGMWKYIFDAKYPSWKNVSANSLIVVDVYTSFPSILTLTFPLVIKVESSSYFFQL